MTQRTDVRGLRNLRGSTALACGVLWIAAPLQAQTLEWIGGNGNWNAADAQWALPGAAPSDPPSLFTDGSSVVFGGDGLVPATVTVDSANVATPSISFAADGHTIDGAFAITPSAGALAIDMAAVGATATISAPLASGAGDTITVSVAEATSGLVIAGDQSGSLGTLSAAGGLVTLQTGYGGAVSLATGAIVDVTGGIVAGDVTVTGGTFQAQNGVTLNGSVAATGGTVNANGATFDGGLTVSGDAVLSITADTTGDLTNAGVAGLVLPAAPMTITGDFTQEAGDTTHLGTIDGQLRVTGGSFTAADGSRVTGSTVRVTGGSLIADGGAFGAFGGAAATIDVIDAGAVTIAADTVADIDLDDGAVTVDAGQTLTGAVTLVERVAPVAGATLTNNGTITGLVNNVDGTILANGAFDGGIRNTGGTLTIVGDTTGDVQNRGGDFTINAGQTLTGDFGGFSPASSATNNGTLVGDIRQNFGRFDNNGTITGDSVISGGEIANIGTIDGTVTVRTSSGNVGTLTDTNGRVTGKVTNSTGAVVATGTTFDTQFSQIGGTLTASGVTFADGINNRGGTTTISGADGAVTTGDVINDGGALVVESGQVLRGDINTINVASQADIAGTLDGDVTLFRGSVDVTGTLDGAVDVTGPSGILNGDGGEITGQVTVAAGTVNANGTNFSGGIVANAGDVVVTGDSAGSIRNAGGTVAVNAGQTFTGDVTNTTGTFNNNGTIAGDVVASGGVWNQNAGADTTGLTTLGAGGRIDANGGAFSGGLLLQDGGIFNRNATTTVDIVNDDGGLNIAAGETLLGSVRNIAGAATVAGNLQGALDVDGGVVTTAATTFVRDATTVNDGQLVANGGTFAGGLVAAGGALDVTADVTAAGADVTGGTLTIDAGATLTADVAQTAGTTILQGTLDGGFAQSGGTAANTGTLAETLQVSGGTFTQDAGGLVSGTTDVTGNGTLVARGGTFAGIVRNQGGAVDVQGAVAGTMENDAGTVTVQAGGIWQGDLRNAGTVVGAGGAISGAVANTGTLDVTSGDLTVGSFAGAGDVSIGAGQTLSTTTGMIDTGGSLAVVGGRLAGDVSVATGAALSFDGGGITGALTSLTDFESNGDVTVTGPMTLDGAAQGTITSGSFGVDGAFDVARDATLTVQSGSALRAGALRNAGAVLAQGAAQFSGDFENAGTLTVQEVLGDGGATFNGRVTNTGAITASGTLAFAGGLTNAGTLDLVNGDTSDRVTVGGAGLTGGGLLRFDVDLSDNEGAADRITLTDGAFLTGDVTLQFNVLGSGGQQATDIVLIDTVASDPGDFNIIADEILDPSGILTYSVARNAAGDVVIEDGLNPGIAGLAGNIVLTQSLIGSVVNRPSSPFVTSLAYEDPDACGAGMWARGIGGGASSQGEVTQDGADGRAFDGRISASFAGIQLGGDFACFNGAAGGWDLAFGAIGGVNTGQTTQPVFAIDVTSETNLSALQTGTTDVDFAQFYGGIYATAVQGPWALDLQYRVERTDFTATNTGLNGLPGLGLDDTGFTSRAHTISGAASYFYSLREPNMTFVPTAGFAFSQIETDPITFTDRGVVRIDDFDSKIGFIGASLARSSFGDDGVSAWRQFLSGTVYNDFAEGPTSTFTPVDNSGDRGLTSENLGAYTEISFGVNYVRVLQENEWGAMKQWSGNARADVRLSDRLKSWGVTVQARYQF